MSLYDVWQRFIHWDFLATGEWMATWVITPIFLVWVFYFLTKLLVEDIREIPKRRERNKGKSILDREIGLFAGVFYYFLVISISLGLIQASPALSIAVAVLLFVVIGARAYRRWSAKGEKK